MTFLLDTNVCIAFLNGVDARVREVLLAADPADVVLCSVVKAELLYGARKSRHVDRNLGRLDSFFAAFESLDFDDAAASQYGLLRAALEARGTPIGANDLIIGATALAADAAVVTRDDAEFRRIPGLRVVTW